MNSKPERDDGAPPTDEHKVRSVGRGGLALTAAKLYFLLLGLGQQVLLTWLLKEGYGGLRGALSPASITYNPLIVGSVQGMSRAVSRGQGAEPKSLRSALGVHAGIASLAGGGFFVLAPVLGDLLHSAYLVPALRWLGIAIFGYGLYAPLVGILNGQRRFVLQACLDMLAATLRTVALFFGAWMWIEHGNPRAVAGSSLAFALVTLAMFLLTLVLARPKLTGASRPSAGEHLAFVAPVMLSQLLLNLLLQADTNTLRAFATRAAERAGFEAEAADGLVGAYSAAQLFGFLPYQVLMGLSFIVFPMLAKAQANDDRDGIRSTTEAGLRIALLVTGAIVSVSSGLAPSLLRAAFPAFATIGGESMKLLSVGLGGFAVFGMANTVLNSLGRQWRALSISLLALSSVVVFNVVMVMPLPFGEPLLSATAQATSLGILVGLVASIVEVRKATGAFISIRTVLRTVLATGLSIALGRLSLNTLLSLSETHPRLFYVAVLAMSLLVVIAYLGILVLARELGRGDLKNVLAVVQKKK